MTVKSVHYMIENFMYTKISPNMYILKCWW